MVLIGFCGCCVGGEEEAIELTDKGVDLLSTLTSLSFSKNGFSGDLPDLQDLQTVLSFCI